MRRTGNMMPIKGITRMFPARNGSIIGPVALVALVVSGLSIFFEFSRVPNDLMGMTLVGSVIALIYAQYGSRR